MNCRLLDGFFSILMQLLLGALSFFSLILKRKYEYPQRELRVFVYDTSKQVIASLFAHLLNIIFALKLAKLSLDDDQCKVYFINFSLDVGFGLILSCLLNKFINHQLKRAGYSKLISGNYPDQVDKIITSEYLAQLGIWISIVLFYKLVVFFAIIIPAFSFWENRATDILYFLSNNPKVELFLVMVLFPLIFNIIQYWVTDCFLKGHGFIKDVYLIQKPIDRENSLDRVYSEL